MGRRRVAAEQTPLLDGVATAQQVHDDLRAREDDPTPRGVVRAVLEAVIGPRCQLFVGAEVTSGVIRPRLMRGLVAPVGEPTDAIRVLDVCAGWGCWASEMRRLAALQGWPVHITGIEIDASKSDHLLRWCDSVDLTHWLDPLFPDSRWDIVVGNPHFTALTHDDPERSMPAVLLRHAPAVLLFHQEQSFQKSEAGARIWHRYPPAAVFHVPGSVRFRVGTNPKTGKPYGADARCYQATLWLRGHEGPALSTMLRWLSAEERRWRNPPGTESSDEARVLGLPLAPNYQEPA